jgi:uridine kinase
MITEKTKIIFVCGPSSSAKTTFSNKLVHFLKKAKRISMDDFFEDPWAETVPKINGIPDYEHLYALRVDFLK